MRAWGALVLIACGSNHSTPVDSASGDTLIPDAAPGSTQHYEYVISVAGHIDVYDLDHGFTRIKDIAVPELASAGYMLSAVASPITGMLYISAGNQGGSPGHVVKWDLVHDQVVWAKTYAFDVDSAALTPDGQTLYQATGAMVSTGVWEIIDASSGMVTGSIDSGGTGPHDTIVTLDGSLLLLGPRHSNNLVIVNAATKQIIQHVGPVANGVRPFTIDSRATYAFINTQGLIGFYVGNIATGQIMYTVPVPNFGTVGSCGGSHGLSLSPDEKELYVADCSYSYVHVFDVTGLPGTAPVDIADIKLTTPAAGEGWLQHTRDGRYVMVGADGDVIDTTTRKVAGNLPAMNGSQIFTEVDFRDGAVSFSPLSRNQGGYGP